MQLQQSLENRWEMHVWWGMQKKHHSLQNEMQRLQHVLHWQHAAEIQNTNRPTLERSMRDGKQKQDLRLICEPLRHPFLKQTNKTYRWRGAKTHGSVDSLARETNLLQ